MDFLQTKINPTDQVILPGCQSRRDDNFEQLREEFPNISLEFAETKNELSQKVLKIPLLFYKYQNSDNLSEESDLYTIYFHGNGEAIFSQMYLFNELSSTYHTNFVAMEYSGYSIYTDHGIDANQIKADAVATFDYLVTKKGIKPEKIVVFGRSIGSGPACYLGSQRKCASVILFSGFSQIVTWLKEKNYQKQVEERFDNLGCVQHFKSPAAIIHGKADRIIDVSHSYSIVEEFKKHSLTAKGYFHEGMDHNYFSSKTIAQDIMDFLKEQKIIQ